jgi:Leucine-rich repeat (LRR) protein
VSLETHQNNVERLVTLLRSLTHLKLESTPAEASTHWPKPRTIATDAFPRSGSMSSSSSSSNNGSGGSTTGGSPATAAAATTTGGVSITASGALQSSSSSSSLPTSTVTSLSVQGVTDEMAYSLSLFPSLRTLEIKKCEPLQIRGLSLLRPRLEKLVVRECGCDLRQLLSTCMADQCNEPSAWGELKFLSVRTNDLKGCDESLKLLPKVQVMDLSSNAISSLDHFQECIALKYLNLGFNHLRTLDNIHLILGNLTTLILRNNKIERVGAVARLYSLEKLDLSNNLIGNFEEVALLSVLPNIEALWLNGNPLSSHKSYRAQTLQILAYVIISLSSLSLHLLYVLR